ncbi:Casparian strip membrane protein 5 [Linum grandiflorum]
MIKQILPSVILIASTNYVYACINPPISRVISIHSNSISYLSYQSPNIQGKMAVGAVELGEAKGFSTSKAGVKRGVAALDFILRLLGFIGTLGSAIMMATTNETLPFVTQFIRFRAEYNDLPTFTFFVVANGVVSAYLLLSLPLSIFHILRSTAKNSRIILLIFDTAALALLTAGASAAAAIVYLAHRGNTKANWLAICQQFNSFCERISGSLIGSYVGVTVFILLILLSASALSRR